MQCKVTAYIGEEQVATWEAEQPMYTLGLDDDRQTTIFNPFVFLQEISEQLEGDNEITLVYEEMGVEWEEHWDINKSVM